MLLSKAQDSLTGWGSPRPRAGHILTVLSSFPEEAAALDKLKVVAKAKERSKRTREEPEKIMKQWGRDHDDTERDTDEELLNGEGPILTPSGQEENRQMEVEKHTSSRRELGATAKDSREVMERQSGEAGKGLGAAGEEVSRSESREIYRRPSDLDQKHSEELIKNGSKDEEKSPSGVNKRESDDLPEVDLEETDSAEKMEK